MGEELDKFIGDILEAKQYIDLDQEVRDQLASDLKQSLLQEIDKALINALPDDKLDEFNKLLDQSDMTAEQLQAFIAQSGVDVQKIIVRTMVAFRTLYLQAPQEGVA
jgi:hypothetical protein